MNIQQALSSITTFDQFEEFTKKARSQVSSFGDRLIIVEGRSGGVSMQTLTDKVKELVARRPEWTDELRATGKRVCARIKDIHKEMENKVRRLPFWRVLPVQGLREVDEYRFFQECVSKLFESKNIQWVSTEKFDEKQGLRPLFVERAYSEDGVPEVLSGMIISEKTIIFEGSEANCIGRSEYYSRKSSPYLSMTILNDRIDPELKNRISDYEDRIGSERGVLSSSSSVNQSQEPPLDSDDIDLDGLDLSNIQPRRRENHPGIIRRVGREETVSSSSSVDQPQEPPLDPKDIDLDNLDLSNAEVIERPDHSGSIRRVGREENMAESIVPLLLIRNLEDVDLSELTPEERRSIGPANHPGLIRNLKKRSVERLRASSRGLKVNTLRPEVMHEEIEKFNTRFETYLIENPTNDELARKRNKFVKQLSNRMIFKPLYQDSYPETAYLLYNPSVSVRVSVYPCFHFVRYESVEDWAKKSWKSIQKTARDVMEIDLKNWIKNKVNFRRNNPAYVEFSKFLENTKTPEGISYILENSSYEVSFLRGRVVRMDGCVDSISFSKVASKASKIMKDLLENDPLKDELSQRIDDSKKEIDDLQATCWLVTRLFATMRELLGV